MFRSVIANSTVLTDVFVQQVQECPLNRLINMENMKEKGHAVYATVMKHDFWDTLDNLSPMVNIFSNIVAHLESDTASLSLVPLEFLFMRSASQNSRPDEHIMMELSLCSRRKESLSDVHILAQVLDPAVDSNV